MHEFLSIIEHLHEMSMKFSMRRELLCEDFVTYRPIDGILPLIVSLTKDNRYATKNSNKEWIIRKPGKTSEGPDYGSRA